MEQVVSAFISLLVGEYATTLLLGLAFLATTSLFLFGAFVVTPALGTRRRIRQQLSQAGGVSPQSLLARQQAERLEADLPVRELYSRIERGEADSLQSRLYRAGFFSSSAPMVFYAIRIMLCTLMFILAFGLVRWLFPDLPLLVLFVPAAFYALCFLVVPNIVLDRIATKREQSCRRGFPDFMDLMVVCAEAGMSLEAAAQRVSDEIGYTHKALGLHLKIMVLEMRAGRALREALANLAERLDFDEARTLAVLFKQSEELGTDLTQTLRVYSAEMREKRTVAAEEKANALPVKIVLPLGFCVFPVMLVMIMLPVIIRMMGVFF